MDKVKILVACHKPYDGYRDDVYTPIHVGRAISRFKEEMADMIGDDTGDNISEKNLQYCELTAQYWAWKNLHDVEYVGFCHYRRFFNISKMELKNKLRYCDVIALKRHDFLPMYWEIVRYISLEHLTILLMVIKKKFPEYEKTMVEYLNGNIFYHKNMLICKKELFDDYAKWLFDILFECEKNMKHVPYSRLERSLAYMGEYLMPVYMMHNNIKISFVGYNDSPNHIKKINTLRTHMGNFRRDVIHFLVSHSDREFPKSLEDFIFEPVIVGFKQDNINI